MCQKVWKRRERGIHCFVFLKLHMDILRHSVLYGQITLLPPVIWSTRIENINHPLRDREWELFSCHWCGRLILILSFSLSPFLRRRHFFVSTAEKWHQFSSVLCKPTLVLVIFLELSQLSINSVRQSRKLGCGLGPVKIEIYRFL